MALASYQQTNFLAGEWSPFYQGRADHPKYRSAMNVCRNGLPLEEGTWTRRPGTRLYAPTYKNQKARIYPVEFTADEPYDVEFTNGAMRFYQGHSLVFTTDGAQSVSSVSTANPAVLTVASAVTWASDDEIMFFFDTAHASGALPLRQRVVRITKVTTTTFSLQDAITGADIDGSLLDMPSGATITAKRVLRVTTPYTNESWANCRIIQNQDMAIVLNRQVAPYMLTITAGDTAGTADATFKICARHDGPYLDPVPNSVATPSSNTGEIVVNVAFKAWDSTVTYGLGAYVSYSSKSYQSLKDGSLNQQPDTATTYWDEVDNGVAVTGAFLPEGVSDAGFQDNDVGRHIRLYASPPEWDSSTTYSSGYLVTRNNQAYLAGASNSNIDPVSGASSASSTTGLVWVPVAGYQVWTWGIITQVLSTTSVNVHIRGANIPTYNGSGTPDPAAIWRLGLFADTTFYPATGTFYEGRFWLGGCVPNRFDTTESQGFDKDGLLKFAPTLADGTVTDASGLSYTLQSRDANEIEWFEPDHNDLICGTMGGEWMLQASSIGEPITPTSIRAKRVTKYGCANIEPRRTGISLVFVQKYKRRIMEFLSNTFSGRYTAPHLNETAKHLTTDGVEEIAYQEELAPILWARTGST